MRPDDLDALEALAKGATAGEWWDESGIIHAPIDGGGAVHPAQVRLDDYYGFTTEKARAQAIADAAYIVAACNAVPALIARIREHKTSARIRSLPVFAASRNAYASAR